MKIPNRDLGLRHIYNFLKRISHLISKNRLFKEKTKVLYYKTVYCHLQVFCFLFVLNNVSIPNGHMNFETFLKVDVQGKMIQMRPHKCPHVVNLA